MSAHVLATREVVVDENPPTALGPPATRSRAGRVGAGGPDRWPRILEALAVLASPVVLYFVLRLRGMAPMAIPDPAIHSTYIFDPQDFFRRYAAALGPTARLREGARVGFLVPARLAYLVFGAVRGFFVFRYVLALVAVVPAYLLLRRLYGVGAGALAVVVIMASPVVVTAWGSDFPDSAVVSYLIGGLACLMMPLATRRARVATLAVTAVLFTMAVWALATSALLIATTLVIYLLARWARRRTHLLADVSLLAAVAAAVTLALGVASRFELGQFNYIKPTIDALRYLNTPGQRVLWHSTNWRWAPYDAYVLVPFAVVATWFAVFVRRSRPIGSVQLVTGLILAGQCVVSVYLQFFNHVQVLEEPYISAALWSTVELVSVIVLAELTRPLAGHRAWRFAPAATVVALALGYEAYPHVPAFGWSPFGWIVAAILVGGAVVARCLATDPSRAVRRFGAIAAVVMVSGASLTLTVAPVPAHARLRHTAFDPDPSFATALGGSSTQLIDYYRLTSEVPAFVGHAAYRGEQLLTCWSSASDGPTPEYAENLSVIGLYHASFNMLPGSCPRVGILAIQRIYFRHAAQLLVISEAPMRMAVLLSTLALFRPVIVRHTVLHSGSSHLDLWLVDLRVDMPSSPA